MSQRNQILIFDIEATGLLRQASKIHCIVTRDVENPEETLVFDHRPDQTIDMLSLIHISEPTRPY